MSARTPRDSYLPGRDHVAPISLRPHSMELLWICGDCGAHYPRTTDPPKRCASCDAPRQHFYAPAED